MFKRYGWIFWVMIPVGMIAGLIVASVYLYLVPRVYESEVLVEIKPLAKATTASTPDAHYMTSAEFEPFKTRTVLLRVGQKLNLMESWGVDEEAVLTKLKDVVQVTRIRGTSLVSVKARSSDPVEARNLARELAKTYREWRKELVQESKDRMLEELRRAVEVQEDRVEESRKVHRIMERIEVNRPEDRTDQIEAKRDLEMQLALLEQMKLKLVSEEIESTMIEAANVIYDEPEIPNKPVGLSDLLIMGIGMLGGALISPLFALPVMALLNRRGRPDPA